MTTPVLEIVNLVQKVQMGSGNKVIASRCTMKESKVHVINPLHCDAISTSLLGPLTRTHHHTQEAIILLQNYYSYFTPKRKGTQCARIVEVFDSLIAEGGVKSRDLSWVIYIYIYIYRHGY